MTSGQEGGVDRHASPPYTTIRRITTNLKTKNTQNCQIIELYKSLTTKDLKKPYLSRQVGGAERMQCGGGVAARRMGGSTLQCGG